jgi:hypothetical protein
MAALRTFLVLDARRRGNDEANGLFWFKNREFNPIRTVLSDVLVFGNDMKTVDDKNHCIS